MAVVDAKDSFKFHIKELKEHLKKADKLVDILAVNFDDPKKPPETFPSLRKAILESLEHLILAEEYYWLWRSEKDEHRRGGGGKDTAGEGNG